MYLFASFFCKYLQVFLSRYVEIDQVVFDKNTYAILTNRFTDDHDVPSTFSGNIKRTRYVLLGVKSTYLGYVRTSTYSYNSNSHFISGAITLAAIRSLLPTLV